jgi:hypothetical protein
MTRTLLRKGLLLSMLSLTLCAAEKDSPFHKHFGEKVFSTNDKNSVTHTKKNRTNFSEFLKDVRKHNTGKKLHLSHEELHNIFEVNNNEKNIKGFSTKRDKIEIFFNVLNQNESLETLTLSGGERYKNSSGKLIAQDIIIILSCIHKTGIKKLNISRCRIDLGNIDNNLLENAIQHMTGETTLENLKLSESYMDGMSKESLDNFLKILEKIKSLKVLDLHANTNYPEDNSDIILESLSKYIASNPSIKALNLSDNRISKKGMKHFSEALDKNNVLKKLDLSSNFSFYSIRSSAKKDLEHIPFLEKNNTLRCLNISKTDILSHEFDKTLQNISKNKNLNYLDVIGCHIEKEKEKKLKEKLKVGKRWITLLYKV